MYESSVPELWSDLASMPSSLFKPLSALLVPLSAPLDSMRPASSSAAAVGHSSGSGSRKVVEGSMVLASPKSPASGSPGSGGAEGDLAKFGANLTSAPSFDGFLLSD